MGSMPLDKKDIRREIFENPSLFPPSEERFN
jgi:hypothetical protein